MNPRSKLVATSDNRAHWLAERRKYVTASDVAPICGCGTYKSAMSVFNAKLNAAEQPDNKHMRRGREAEPQIFSAFVQKMGFRGRRIKGLYASLKYPWLAASPDGIVKFRNGPSMLLEIKSTGVNYPQPPRDWIYQIYTQMLVTGIHRAYLVVASAKDPRKFNEFIILPHSRDFSLILDRTKSFFDCLQKKELTLEFWP